MLNLQPRLTPFAMKRVLFSMKTIIISLVCFCILPLYGFGQPVYQKQKLVSSDRGQNEVFGAAVAISGNYAISSAYNDSEDENGANPVNYAGSVFIYERDSADNWIQVQKIVAPDRYVGDGFGYRVALSGNIAAICSLFEDEDAGGLNNMPQAGAVYIFMRDSSRTWNFIQKIVPSDRQPYDAFGYAIAISGNYIVAGAYQNDYDFNGGNYISNAGAAYFFERDSTNTWQQVQKVVSPDRGVNEFFGMSCSIDSTIAVIGSTLDNEDAIGSNYISEAGSASIFTRDSSGTWNFTQKIVAADRGLQDGFGLFVSIDLPLLAVVAPYEDEDENGLNTLIDPGSVYVFEQNQAGVWLQEQKLVPPDRKSYQQFGTAIEIEGNHLICGARIEPGSPLDTAVINAAGAAYIFERNGNGNWSMAQKIVAMDRELMDQFGISVALSGGYYMAGAWYDDLDISGNNLLSQAGAAYIFGNCITTTYGSASVTGCNSYTVPSGNATYTVSGVYSDTIPGSIGCDSILTITINIVPVDTGISVNQQTITANAAGAVYQWILCPSGIAVPNATGQSYTPAVTGNYAVIVTENGCSDTSACTFININNIGMNEYALSNSLHIFPQPAADVLYFDTNGIPVTALKVWDNCGRQLQPGFSTQGQLAVGSLAPGMYMLEVHTAQGIFRNRFFKK